MNAAQIHLALNHAPLFLSLIGGILLIVGMIKKNETLKSVSLYMLVAAAAFTAPVYLTGEGTEELVENMAGVNEAAIEEHEEMAQLSLIIIIVSGVVALLGLLTRKRESLSKIILGGAVLLSLASFGTMAQTAHLGGLIRHSEIQTGAVSTPGEKEEDEEKEEKDSIRPEQKVSKDSADVNEKKEGKKDDDD
jgi:uncharacterized membrane protein